MPRVPPTIEEFNARNVIKDDSDYRCLVKRESGRERETKRKWL
jgi:hypothetical protein